MLTLTGNVTFYNCNQKHYRTKSDNNGIRLSNQKSNYKIQHCSVDIAMPLTRCISNAIMICVYVINVDG